MPPGMCAGLGDFGFIDHKASKAFIRLGNLADFLENVGDISYTWSGNNSTECGLEYEWDGTTYTYKPEPGYRHCSCIPEQIPLYYVNIFFWFHAMKLAEHHRIDARQLILRELDALYFHQLPVSDKGEVLSPLGYWSAQTSPTPGPWPNLLVPNKQLNSGATLLMACLNNLHVELLRCFREVMEREASDSFFHDC
ncbi:hypothetical protein CERSUDRAFT_96592 [Gelatoporia subvermispora B]|uniref:Uncharacterized protein n=1 Tax=Ceriporiopsis subvermispora (strain B) TaxID=914234 RepID=M2R9P5_CERS8|nr:hypothetical protein CERSUDRAFT_96592 [Gelatoporia subvermispora B]